MSNEPTQHSSLSELLDDLEEDAQGALSRCKPRFESSARAHHENVHEVIAFIVAFVLRLRKSRNDRDNFLDDDYWAEKPRPPEAEDLSRLTTMYIVGALRSRGALYQQALEHTKVVDFF